MHAQVAMYRLFPGFTTASLETALAPPLKGLVLSTFGAGNAPDLRKEMLQALRSASDCGVVIVNITQCSRGKVEAHYATGTALVDVSIALEDKVLRTYTSFRLFRCFVVPILACANCSQ